MLDDGLVESGTVLGVADGAFGAASGVLGAALGTLGAALGVLGAVLGVTSGVAPGSVGMVDELGLVAVGGFVASGVLLGDCCGLIVLCELGLLDCAVPPAVPLLEGALDWANAQQPHSSIVLAKRISLRFMVFHLVDFQELKWPLLFRWTVQNRGCLVAAE